MLNIDLIVITRYSDFEKQFVEILVDCHVDRANPKLV